MRKKDLKTAAGKKDICKNGRSHEDHALMERVGYRIRLTRKNLGLTQEALGEMTGIASAYISIIELGKKSASFLYIKKIADALNITTDELVCEEVGDTPA